jgi:hypothetical protein
MVVREMETERWYMKEGEMIDKKIEGKRNKWEIK